MNEMFSVAGKVAVISGAAGVLGGSLARHFASQGADVVGLVHRTEQVSETLESLQACGGNPQVYECNVMDAESLRAIAASVKDSYGKVDILINVAGGNVKGANVMPDQNFWDMKLEDWTRVLDLNLNGTVYPCYVFSEIFAAQGFGCILNISSMAAYDALTRVAGYGAAKEGVSNFTRWLSAELAIKYGDKIRVNALAPGFFIGKQNRAALLNEDGSLTERSVKVIAKTPMRRFGDLTELNGAAQFLCSDAASFVTGVVLPVDGGFSSFSGV
ncbi:MAG: SDR family oxidoreductase [Candidatus Cryptobacteroides sp.]|nr:SDR family oxidoreductase [Bacteroidales bacterium]